MTLKSCIVQDNKKRTYIFLSLKLLFNSFFFAQVYTYLMKGKITIQTNLKDCLELLLALNIWDFPLFSCGCFNVSLFPVMIFVGLIMWPIMFLKVLFFYVPNELIQKMSDWWTKPSDKDGITSTERPSRPNKLFCCS